MKVIYTEAAQQELVAFQEKQKRMLEELIAEKKYVYGDEALEITASDIKECAERIRPFRPAAKRLRSIRGLAMLYVAVGAVMMVGAAAYPALKNLYADNREQGMVFLAGLMMSFFGAVISYMYKLRLQRYEEMEKEVQRKLATEGEELYKRILEFSAKK